MREGVACRVTFGSGSLFDTVVIVVSFEDGDDAIKLARVATDCELPVKEVTRVGACWVSA